MKHKDESLFLVTLHVPHTVVYSDGDFIVISQLEHEGSVDETKIKIPMSLVDKLQYGITKVVNEKNGFSL